MNLLIIDDNRICNLISTRTAEISGLFKDVRSVYNGKDALEIFEQVCHGTATAPDVILLDLNMPVMNGFDFIEALRQLTFPNKEHLAIAILTASDNTEDIEKARAMGIDHYLLKSLTLRDLQSIVFSLYNRTLGKARDYMNNLRRHPAA